MMRNNLLLFIFILPLHVFSQNIDYSGEWIDSSPPSTISSIKRIPGGKFENTLTLEKITNQENSYQFSFFGWRDSYDTFAGQVIKFSGEMMGDHFTIELKDSNAYYTDDVLILVDEFPLYNKGEERCKVHFMFNEDFITVQTLDCDFIYGGFGVAFDGTYKKRLTPF